MPPPMSRARQEAFNNLKLDTGFFQHMLRKELSEEAPGQDYDLYLMEKGVMPLLLQGLDALARHMDKIKDSDGLGPNTGSNGIIGTGGSGRGQAPFNPLTWLAQYLLRNHPAHVKDHRAPVYQHLRELASLEKGRRVLLRRRPQMEEVWEEMVQAQSGAALAVSDIPDLVQRLDKLWNVEGAFAARMPRSFAGLFAAGGEEAEVQFMDFWGWFEDFVAKADILRASDFEEADRRRAKSELEAEQGVLEQARRERAIQEVLEVRRSLEEQFDTICADMYINAEIGNIINKGAVIVSTDDAQPKGEHVALILALMHLWGCPLEDGGVEDEWNEEAHAAWNYWLEEHGPEGAVPNRVDSMTLKHLMDRVAFQEYVAAVHPVKEATIDESEIHHMVEVRGFIDDDIDLLVEAIDEDTGALLQLTVPDHLADDLRRRLDMGDDEPVLARVNRMTACLVEILPPAFAVRGEH